MEQMDYCLWSSGEWVLRVFLVAGVARSLSHTSPLCLPSTLAFVQLYFAWCCFVYRDVSHSLNLFTYKAVWDFFFHNV